MILRINERWRYVSAVATIAFGIGLSVLVFSVERHREYREIQSGFKQEAAERYDSLKREIQFDLHALEALAAFYQASNEVDPSQFRSFVKPLLDRHQSIQALEWIPRVSASQRETYEKRARRTGFPFFQITEKDARGQMVRARARPEYFPVYFVEPYRGNELALGFDLASNQTRGVSLQLARDTGRITATSRVVLVQETANQPGLLVFAPVYSKQAPPASPKDHRKHLVGFALGVFRISTIMEHSLAHLNPKQINVTLYDQSAPAHDRFLCSYVARTHKAAASTQDNAAQPAFRYAERLDVAGRQWVAVFTPSPGYLGVKRSWQPWKALTACLFFTALLASYLCIVTGRAQRVERLVRERTLELSQANTALHTEITERGRAEEALKKGEARFRQLFDGVDTGIIVRDVESLQLLDANRKFCEMYGYTLDELKRLPLGSLGAGESVEERRRRLIDHYRHVEKGGSTTFQLEAMRKDGSTFWAETKVQRLALAGTDYLLTISRDVTQLRRAEEALKRSEEAARLLAQETGVIAEIGRIISSSLDIEEVYERFAEVVYTLTPFDRIVVNLVNTQEGTVTIAYVSGVEIEGREKQGVFLLKGTSMEEMVRTQAPVLFYPQSVEDARTFGLFLAFEAGLRSRLLVPLFARGEVIGGLSLWSKQPKAYGERDVRLAQSVASQVAGAIANARLYLERKRAEEALRESEESYRSLVETSPDAIFLHEGGRLVYLNPAAVRLLGVDGAQELYGKNAFDIVHPSDREAVQNRTASIMATGIPAPLKEIRMLRCDGSDVNVEAVAGISYYRGKKVVQVIQRDVTERKRAEEKIRASLREKEVLLKEIHHRVKNNLQIVSSLLYLQAARTEHPGAISALRESQSRVRSMALIHERLYQAPNLASVDMGEYTRNLVSDLQNSYRTDHGLVRLTLTIDDVALGITEAIPCGLIINELVSNALKHAFPKGRDGEITIRLCKVNAHQTTLTVRDDGVGFPEHVDFRESPSLGLTLMNSLVKQLGGTIELDRTAGTAFTITFP